MNTTTAPWRVQLFGSLRAQQGDRAFSRFSTYKTGALFVCLAYHRENAQPREALVEMFWPDAAPPSARNSLSAALSSLRRQLEPPGLPPGAVLQADRTAVWLNPDMVVTDVARFEAAARTVLGGRPGEAADGDALEAAIRLYTGELLPGFYEDWVGGERERLADLYRSLLNSLIQNLADAHAFERALAYAHKAIESDPLRESSHRTLMRLYAATGRPMAALEHFRSLEHRLKQALNVAPSQPTHELARGIARKLGTSDPPSASQSAQIPAASALPPSPLPSQETQGPTGSLPLRLTRFFGRESERDGLQELLSALDVRLVTLTGPGGIGKSRLSVEAAQDAAPALGGRVWFVPLEDLTEPERIIEAVRDALCLPRGEQADPWDQAVQALAGAPCLLVLDNFEQLAGGGGPIVRTLLERLPGLTCLLTSRQALGLDGEREFALSPLPTPPEGAGREAVAAAASVRLFVDRAQARRVDFAVTPGNAEAVAALCRALEGIPLALELAAVWARMLTPAQMRARLSQRFDLLVSSRADLPARHRTLRAVVGSSVSLLSEDLQSRLAALSVFRGGWTGEAAAEVCSAADSCLDDLRRLQERSLIVAEEAGDSMRYRMLETIREYAAEQLTREEVASCAWRHAQYYQGLAQEAREALDGPAQAQWLDRLESERANLRAALDWALQNDPEMALCVPEALWRFWGIRGYRPQGRGWLEEALQATAAETREEVVRLRAHALNALGLTAVGQGDYRAGLTAYEESLALFRHFGDQSCVASTLNNIGVVALDQDDYAAARPVFEEALALKRGLGDERSLASTLSNLGQIAEGLGDFAAARSYYQESLAIARKFGLNWGIAHLLTNLAELAFREGEPAAALALQRQSLLLWQELGDKQNTAETLMAISLLLFTAHGLVDSAVRLAAAAGALLSETGGVLRPSVRERQQRHEAAMHAALGAATYDALWSTGSVLPCGDAVAEALSSPRLS